MAVAYLRVRAQGVAPQTLAISDELTIGRGWLGNGASARDAKMSRRHARFFLDDDGQAWVEDLQSTNGTFVNGDRIDRPYRLQLGDEIRLSSTTFELVAAAATATAPAPGGRTQEPAVRAGPPKEARRGRRAQLRAKWAEQRARRARLPPFPNYTEVPSLLTVRAWWIVRATGVVATLVVVALLFAVPATGLRITWGVGIPLLPILFFVAPGLWRNICPLAASNQTPRVLGFTRALEPPAWLKRYGYLVSISLFTAFITLRKVGLQTNGPLSALLLLAALAGGFTGGIYLKGKSGWCSSICPLLPVQRLYGQTPFALIANRHCQPCVGCAKNCYDFNPRAAYLADLNDEDQSWRAGRKFFAAVFPGLVLGFFEVPNVPRVSVPLLYGELCLYIAVGVLVFFLIDSFAGISSHKVTTLYAAVALNIFYWFAFPTIVRAITSTTPSLTVDWVQRALLASLSALWVLRTYGKEVAFLEQAGSAVAGRHSGSRSIARYAASRVGKPEVKFLPADRTVVAEPGQTLLELAEANDLEIEAGCRMGVCGADPVAILDGMSNLSSVSDSERATLERLGLAENTRMACCCRVKGPVSVSLEPDQQLPPTPSRVISANLDRSVERVVVIGNGIAGITAADYVRRNHPECKIDIVAEEAYELYNRMAITRLIYGRSAMHGLQLNPDSWCEARNITLWLNTRARAIDRERREVVLGTDERLTYDRLIVTTGSSSFVPAIDGWGVPGAFVLRTANDALEIRAFAQLHGARRAVVGGGGLLGLEAAYALHKLGLATTVLERSERLLRRQLDERAAALLRRYMERLGIAIWTNAECAGLSHNGRLAGLTLKDGRSAAAELLIVAAGIEPNLELARDAGIETGRGIIVDEHMRTSDERIFAAGDVAEFDGQVAGLWPAAVDQARVAAEAAVLLECKPYLGSVPVTVLKVVGVELTSVGQISAVAATDEEIVQEDDRTLRYGKLVIASGRIVGAILLGYSREVSYVVTAVTQGWEVGAALDDLRAGRWDVLEQLSADRQLNSVSVVAVGAS